MPLRLTLLLLLFFLAGCADHDLATLRKNFHDYCLAPATARGDRLLDDVELPKASIDQVHSYLARLQPDGAFSDVPYASKARSAWQPYDHLTRTLALAAYAYGPDTSPEESRAAIAAIHRALAFWIAHDFKSDNWWYNEIGVPKILGITALLFEPDLTPAERRYITQTVLPRSKISRTGQNKVWLAGNTLMRGVLINDATLVRTAATAIADEIALSTGPEGIQPDWSFHQHGPQLQFGNYGMAFAVDMARWCVVLRETRFAFPPEKIAILRNFLLQGESPVIWRGAMDISSCGRQLFPDAPKTKAGVMGAVLRTMALSDPASAADFLAAAKRTEPDSRNDLIASTCFWRSDYLVHRTDHFMATLKMHSNRVIGGETVNNENLSGLHLADGALFLYQNGNEYQNIFPCWDWRKIPGTTEELTEGSLSWNKPKPPKSTTRPAATKPATQPAEPDETNPDDTAPGVAPVEKPRTIPKATDFVGGLTLGNNAVAAIDFVRDDLKAKKAWFFSGNAVICLGAGIECSGPGEVVTTVNQCLLKDKPDPRSDGFGVYFSHDGFMYSFRNSEPRLITGPITGNWKKVFDIPSTPRENVTKNLLTVEISHGSKPQNASYEYAIQSIESLSKYSSTNTAEVQSVHIHDFLGIVFWKAGTFKTDDHQFAADHPCLVAIDLSTRKIRVADPTQKLRTLTLTINGRTIPITLPTGPLAGSSVEAIDPFGR